MALIETYYLIDFENVKEDNLLGAKLGEFDQVHIFSTENVPKISIRLLSVFNATKVFSHVVAVGKQSLDMHLVSYLGYLLGKNENEKARYIIISQDTDYDNVITVGQVLILSVRAVWAQRVINQYPRHCWLKRSIQLIALIRLAKAA